MEAIKAIHGRRSIRKYSDQSVSKELLLVLLEAAMAAPSACNQQAWQFYIVQTPETLAQISKLHPYAAMVAHAAAAIVICGDLELEKCAGYWIQDCSAATQNILLAAHASGLGAVWLGVTPRVERVAAIQRLLDMPIAHVPLAIVSIGYPAEEKAAQQRFKPERVHWDLDLD